MTHIPDDEAYYIPKITPQTHWHLVEVRIFNKIFDELQQLADEEQTTVEHVISNLVSEGLYSTRKNKEQS